MTPEERWTRIEQQTAENQRQMAENARQIARMGEQMERRSIQIDTQIEKNTVAIRDLIVVSRALIDAQQTNEKRMERMERADSEIKAQLDLFIKELRAFLKGFQKPNGNQ
jgi:hypothetical protein